jgi:hypothetical protein
MTFSKEGLIEAAKLGRVAGHSAEARADQAEKSGCMLPKSRPGILLANLTG